MKKIYLLFSILALVYSLHSSAAIIYVNQAATTGSNTGTSWANAYTSFQSALDVTVSGDQIWVAKGTYYPSYDYELYEGDRGFHFEMIEGVAIYGGFAGTETTVDERTDFGHGETNETILSGDIGTIGDNSDNCYHVFFHRNIGLTSSAILDGFTITGGNANDGGPHYYGGGMSNSSSSPTLTNITFIENMAQGGGGIYNYNSLPTLTNVTFTANTALFNGGGIFNSFSSPTFTNVIFDANTATNYYGGGIYNISSSPTFTNVTITLNTAGSHGGGIYNSSSSPALNNCIVWGNTASSSGNQFYIGGGTTTLNYSCYSNGTNDIYNAGTFMATNNNTTDNPKFYDVVNNDYRLYDNSPCVDKGNNSYNTSGTDVRRQVRIQNSTIDMGAYEFTDGVDPVCTVPTDGGEITSAQGICSGSIPETFTSTSLPSGSSGTLEYRWQSSTTSASGGFSDINSANATTYTSGALTVTTWFKRLAKTSCMDWTDAIASNVIEVTVYENPSVPAITDGSNTYIYDGTVKTASANVATGETIDWYDAATDGNVVSAPSETNAGTYSAYAETRNTTTGCTSSNRILVTLTINQLEITVTPDTDQSKEYGETDPTLTCTCSPGLVTGDAFSGALSRETGENVGTYAISIGTMSAGDNYIITLADKNFSITAKNVTVTPNAKQSKVYGNSNPTLTYTYTPELISGNAFVGELSREAGEDAGTYAINIGTLSAGGNYSISLAAENFAITVLPVTVTPDAGQSKEYGDADPEITYTVNPTLTGSDAFTGSLERESGENTGTYAINQGTLTAGSNYTLTFITDDFTVTAKPITVTADDGQSKVYGDADPTLTYTFTPELTTGDAFSGELTREAGEDAGTYGITTGTLSAGSNYTISLADRNFTISPRTVYVFSDAALTKEYGDADPGLTYTYTPELIGGTTFSGELLRESGEDAGVYSIGIGTLTAGSNYEIDFNSSYFFITAKKLTISAPDLTTAKEYDGYTMAEVAAGTLSGVLSSDEGVVSVTAFANYDDASIGSGKTITVIYLLDGSAALNYIAPEEYIVYTGAIFNQTTIANLQSVNAGCEGGTFEISYNLLSGEPTEYQILFDESAISAGFSDISYTSLPSSSDAEVLPIDIPDGVAYGTYTAQLQFRNFPGAESDLFSFLFTINIPSDYLIDKFDDVILCDNSPNQFLSYQWYKDDMLISGATNQFYCDPEGLSGTYYVQVVTVDGESLKTCSATYNNVVTEKTAVTVYPNPAQTGQTVAIKVTGADEEELEGAVLYIYNIFGFEVYQSEQVATINYLNLDNQYQNYVIRIITANGKELKGKLTMVR